MIFNTFLYIDKQLPHKSFAELSANVSFTDYQQYSNRYLQIKAKWMGCLNFIVVYSIVRLELCEKTKMDFVTANYFSRIWVTIECGSHKVCNAVSFTRGKEAVCASEGNF